jgi:hypothetical protein
MTPRAPVLACLLALALSPVVLSIAGADAGGFGMFTRPMRYRVSILVERPGRPAARVPIASLAPHMSRDARRVLGPADRWTLGETNASLLAGGLDDLGELVCGLRPAATAVRVALERQSLSGTAWPSVRRSVACR